MLEEVRQTAGEAQDADQIETVLDEARARWPDHAKLVTRTGTRMRHDEPLWCCWARDVFDNAGKGSEASHFVTINRRTYWRIVPSADDAACHPELTAGVAIVVETEQDYVVSGRAITDEEWVRLEDDETEEEERWNT